MNRKVWHNGSIIDEKDAKVSIYDSALMFADLAFEMTRTFNRVSFKLHEHIERLKMSCKVLEIPMTFTWEKIEFYHDYLLEYHKTNVPEVEEWRLLINVSRGILPLYQHMLGDEGKPNVMIACFPLSEILRGKSHLYTEGVHAIVPSQRAIPHHLLDARLKTRSRQHYQMANLEVARQDKDAWPLLLDPDGFVAESTGSNFFIVKNGMVFAPDTPNCLSGISAIHIIKELIDEPFKVLNMFQHLTLYDVYNADEAFFTCTPYSIVPCTKINGKPIGDGKIGEVTKRLTKAWIDSVQCDFVEQAKRWDRV